MNASDILTAVNAGEDKDWEFKSAKGGMPGSLWVTYSAMANTDGGVIVLGVRENDGDFEVQGLDDPPKTSGPRSTTGARSTPICLPTATCELCRWTASRSWSCKCLVPPAASARSSWARTRSKEPIGVSMTAITSATRARLGAC